MPNLINKSDIPMIQTIEIIDADKSSDYAKSFIQYYIKHGVKSQTKRKKSS